MIIRICMDCKVELGTKDDGRPERWISHGLCPACEKVRMEEIDEIEPSGKAGELKEQQK